MKEIWTNAFSAAYDSFSRTDRYDIDHLLDQLTAQHTSAEMRESLRTIAGERVWSTNRLYLTNDVVRISWRYGNIEDTIIVASIEAD